MFRLFECCALSFFERFVLSFSLKIERFVSDSAEIWICGLYLPLAVEHFKDRFADQPWLIYDVKRQYGYYYDLKEMKEVIFENPQQAHLVTGMLNESLMANDEKLFRQLWKTYFKAICIKERWNPRKHRQDMPVRYWKYLTEKQ